MLLQTYTVHNIQLTAKPLNLVEWRAEGANLVGRLTFASSVLSLDRKCQWWRVSICVWVCSRSLWTKLEGHVSARAQVSPITHAILLHIIEVTLCRITKLHNAQVSCLRVCVAGQQVSPRFTRMFSQLACYQVQLIAPRTEVTSQRLPHHEMMSTLASLRARQRNTYVDI